MSLTPKERREYAMAEGLGQWSDPASAMTRRQYYKAAALASLSASYSSKEPLPAIAHKAGEIADAMIEEDKKFNAGQSKTG